MVPEILAEHFELLADAPNGVKKLRELIHALAVRGTLVSQDPDDEPASALLERARGSRSVGTNRVQLEATPHALPNSWEWSQLQDLTTNVHYGYTASANHNLKGVRLLRITDIQNGRVNWEQVPGCEIDDTSFEKNALRDGDLLIARTGGTIGKSYLVQGICVPAVFASYLIRAIPCSAIFPRYLWLFAQSTIYWEQLYAKSAGTGQPNVNATSLKSLIVPVPPLAEQRRIVAKVDELMALCDKLDEGQRKRNEVRIQACTASHAALTSAPTPNQFARHWARIRNHFDQLYDTPKNVQELRQVILQLAVQGKLVPQDSNDHLRVKLLDAPTKADQRQPKWAGPIKDLEKPHQLPSSWAWFRLGDISSLKHGYAFSSKFFTDEPADFVLTTPGNFYEKGGFRDRASKRKYYSGPVDPEFIFKPGDLVIPMTEQAAGLLGSPAFIPDDGRVYVHNQRLGKFRFSESILPEFAFWFFNSKFFRSELARTCTGMKVRHTSPDRILRVPFPACPLAEQRRIVAKVDQLMSICDELESNLTQSQADSEKLMEAVVAGVLNGDSK